MTYIKDPHTGDTLHVSRKSGIYPVRVEKHHSHIVFMQYDETSLCFCEIGETGEYWKECDLYQVGERLNMN